MIDCFIFYQELSSEYFQAYFRYTKTGDIGPIFENLFICIRIKGNIVSLTNNAESPSTLHQGKPAKELKCKMESLIVMIKGSKGLKIQGILVR